jgi:RNA polymerase sigma-70 factor (ECF subfamily)
MSIGNLTDDDLLHRLRRGDEAAFLELYRRRQAAIYRFALHVSGSTSAAEDIVQEVFITLLRGDCGYNAERGTLSAYLFGIARKQALRQIERGRMDIAIENDADDGSAPQMAVHDDPLADLTHRESIEALRRAVAALPRRYREVVALCDLEEVDYADAAAALGCPIGTVRSRLHRARALLLDKLNKERPKPGLGALKPARCEI